MHSSGPTRAAWHISVIPANLFTQFSNLRSQFKVRGRVLYQTVFGALKYMASNLKIKTYGTIIFLFNSFFF